MQLMEQVQEGRIDGMNFVLPPIPQDVIHFMERKRLVVAAGKVLRRQSLVGVNVMEGERARRPRPHSLHSA